MSALSVSDPALPANVYTLISRLRKIHEKISLGGLSISSLKKYHSAYLSKDPHAFSIRGAKRAHPESFRLYSVTFLRLRKLIVSPVCLL